MAELVDAQVSKTCDLRGHEGSSPSLPSLLAGLEASERPKGEAPTLRRDGSERGEPTQ